MEVTQFSYCSVNTGDIEYDFSDDDYSEEDEDEADEDLGEAGSDEEEFADSDDMEEMVSKGFTDDNKKWLTPTSAKETKTREPKLKKASLDLLGGDDEEEDEDDSDVVC